MTVKAFDFEAAYEAKCKDCGEPVTVSIAALEACKRSNHILKRIGGRLMTKAEIAICGPCYENHHSRTWAESKVHSEAYERMWRNFRAAYRVAPDDQRPMLEKKLQKGMGEWWPSYSALFTAWKVELDSKRSRGNAGSAGKAGF